MFSGCVATTTVLLRAGVNVMHADLQGRTPAHIAVAKGLQPVLELLVRSGASNPGNQNWPGKGKKWSLKTFWTPDADATHCMCCRDKKFSLSNRRHHCRQCGDVVCSGCTDKAKPPWHTPTNKTENVCFTCKNVWAEEDTTKGIYGKKANKPGGGAGGGGGVAFGVAQDPYDIELMQRHNWFVGTASRSAVDAALMAVVGQVGDYVVRKSSKPGSYALSVVITDDDTKLPRVRHSLITSYQNQWTLRDEASGRYIQFGSVPDLIAYYSTPSSLGNALLQRIAPYAVAAHEGDQSAIAGAGAGSAAGGSGGGAAGPNFRAAAATMAQQPVLMMPPQGLPATPTSASPMGRTLSALSPALPSTPPMPQQLGPMTPANQQSAQWSPMPPTPAAPAAPASFSCPGGCGTTLTSSDRFCVECGFSMANYVHAPAPTPGHASPAAAAALTPAPAPAPTPMQQVQLQMQAPTMLPVLPPSPSPSPAAPSYPPDSAAAVLAAVAASPPPRPMPLPPLTPGPPLEPMDAPVNFRPTGIPEVDEQIKAQIVATRAEAHATEAARVNAEQQIRIAIQDANERQQRLHTVTVIRQLAGQALQVPGISAVPGVMAIVAAAEQVAAAAAAAAAMRNASGAPSALDPAENIMPDVAVWKQDVADRQTVEAARILQEQKEAGARLLLQSWWRGTVARRYAARIRIERAAELAEREARRQVAVQDAKSRVEAAFAEVGNVPDWRYNLTDALGDAAAMVEPELMSAMPGWEAVFHQKCAEDNAARTIQAGYRQYRLELVRQAKIAAATAAVNQALALGPVESIAPVMAAIAAAKALEEPELAASAIRWDAVLTQRIADNREAVERAELQSIEAMVAAAFAVEDMNDGLDLLRDAITAAEMNAARTDLGVSCRDLLDDWQEELAQRELDSLRECVKEAEELPMDSHEGCGMMAEVVEHAEDLTRIAEEELGNINPVPFSVPDEELAAWRVDLDARTGAIEAAQQAERVEEIQQMGIAALLTPMSNVRNLVHVLAAVEDFETTVQFPARGDLNLWTAEHSVRVRFAEARQLDNDINVYSEAFPAAEVESVELDKLQAASKMGKELVASVEQLAPMANTWRQLLDVLNLPAPDAGETMLGGATISVDASSDNSIDGDDEEEDVDVDEEEGESHEETKAGGDEEESGGNDATATPPAVPAESAEGAGAAVEASSEPQTTSDAGAGEDGGAVEGDGAGAGAGGDEEDGTDYDDDSSDGEVVGGETYNAGESIPPTPTAESPAKEPAAVPDSAVDEGPKYDRGYALRCAIIQVQAVVQLAWPSLQITMAAVDEEIQARIMPKCVNCGFDLPPGTNFCESCGVKVTSQSPEPAKEATMASNIPPSLPVLPPVPPPPASAAGAGAEAGAAGASTDAEAAPSEDESPDDWLHSSIDRTKSEDLLSHVGLASGTFLIRESATIAGTFSLSMRDGGGIIKHYRIEHGKDGVTVKGSTNIFPRLQELVAFYRGAASVGDRLSCRLTVACPKTVALMPIECSGCKSILQPSNKFCQGCGKARSEIKKSKPDKWELPRKDIVLMSKIGAGNFGEVRLGRLKQKIDVAVKTSKKSKMTNAAFLEEATKMKELLHKNLVRLYGVCTMDDPIFIVLEFLSGGCVLEFLRTRRGKNSTLQQLAQMLSDIAEGMKFMESVHWVHGDLAARNLLMGGNKVVKICDFGHSVKTNENNDPVWVSQQLPVRWTAPEFYATRTCSPRSDVWSYGVVIFEVLARGEEPYSSFTENKRVIKMLTEGFRMPMHKKVPKYFYDMMLDCWQPEEYDRPTFTRIAKILKAIANMTDVKASKDTLVCKGQQLLPYEMAGPQYTILKESECTQ